MKKGCGGARDPTRGFPKVQRSTIIGLGFEHQLTIRGMTLIQNICGLSGQQIQGESLSTRFHDPAVSLGKSLWRQGLARSLQQRCKCRYFSLQLQLTTGDFLATTDTLTKHFTYPGPPAPYIWPLDDRVRPGMLPRADLRRPSHSN